MKKLLCKFLCVMDSFARARAAAHLTRSGQPEAARKVMEDISSCKC